MRRFILKATERLYFKHWVIGLCRDNIIDIIRSKSFNQDIKWLTLNSIDHYNADPFLLRSKDGMLSILFEDFALDDLYGKIFQMTLDKDLNLVDTKTVLDTKSHLSYPFVYIENEKTYVFPEASQTGRLSCYEYDIVKQSLNFLKVVIDLPMLDSTILRYKRKYWLFGTISGKDSHNKLYIFYSDYLLGPYTPHPGNPVKNSYFNSRPAGNFIEVDGNLYRPSQNCENTYGESLTINKINNLDELGFDEEPYMTIEINEKNLRKHKIHTVHTFNVLNGIIAVDGKKWTFSPSTQWRYFLINRKLLKQLKGRNNFLIDQ